MVESLPVLRYLSRLFRICGSGFLLPDEDSAVIWRGPKKNLLIKTFLANVNWGELDFLIVDTPPGRPTYDQ